MGMQIISLFVAIDNLMASGWYRHFRELPCIIGIGSNADLVVREINGFTTGVVDLHPGIREFIEIIHNQVDIRLHELVDDEFRILCGNSADGTQDHRHCEQSYK